MSKCIFNDFQGPNNTSANFPYGVNVPSGQYIEGDIISANSFQSVSGSAAYFPQGIVIAEGASIVLPPGSEINVPVATESSTGVIQVGIGLEIDGNGILSIAGSGSGYTLPIASNTVLGGVKIDGSTITINGDGVISSIASGSASGGILSVAISTNFNAVDNTRYIVDTISNVVAGTLPSNPSVGAYIEFADAGETWDTNNFTIARNGELINGVAEDFICDINKMKIEMIFVSETFGWQVSATAGASAGTSVLVSNDTTTNANRYPTFLDTTTGVADAIYTSDTKFKYNPSTGQVEAVAFNSTSDARKKTNVVDLEKGLSTVLNMNPKSFELIETGNEGIGFIAQELMETLPEVVSADSEGYLSVNYGVIVAVLVNAIKELKTEIEILKG